MHFHTKYSSEHKDWSCHCGVAYGTGATPEEATLHCLEDMSYGFANSIGWLGAPGKPKAVVRHTWFKVSKTWCAEFTDEFWFKHESGWGDTPEDAILALMNRTDYRHGVA